MFCRKLLTLFPGEIFRNRKVQFPLNVQEFYWVTMVMHAEGIC
ncbi:unnamed protein product [Acanthoscelides obtectus]|uniref:Uncharacterized protein n=1 Tax=Acanthoscelides obtectus TaxID=200917 RepID=A0A9P0Q586_ACAOB|nr:unnamed protein product [Acanthoscelides obtectus]CAK1657516.1 hypothetical protein AOBTE_LOCUS20384 [Acanthoscelides obtectus]